MMLLLAVYCFWAAAVIDTVSSEYTAGGKGLTPVETSKSEPQPGKLTLQSAVAVFANKSQPTSTGSIVFSGLWSVNETFWNDDNQTDAGEISEWVTPKSSSTLPASVTAQMARIRHQRNRWYNMRSRKSVEQGSGYLNLNVSEGGRKAALSGLESNRFIHADGKNASPPNSVGSRSDSRMTTRPFYRLLASGTRRQLGLTSTLTPSGMRSEGQEKFVPILPTFNRTSANIITAPFLGGPTTGPGDAKTTAPKSTKGAPNLENKLRAWGDGMKRVSTLPEFAEGEAQELALSEQSDAELEDAIWPDDEQHPEDFLSAGDNGETKKDALDTNTKPDIDIVTKFLRIVESQHLLGENCTAGTDFNLGEGVVDRYAQERFRLEADIAVNRANWLTRLWKYSDLSSFTSQYLLHASVVSLVEMDEDIFAAGNCYDKHQYKDHSLYCPFAYRLPEGTVLAKDLAVEYKYLSNTSEWFYIARKNAERVIRNMTSLVKTYMMYAFNETAHTERFEDEILSVTYEDGKWSKPYFDCGGGNIWMMTYTVPFFGYNPNNGTYYFKGTSGIDIDLRRVDIDQCELPPGSTQLNIFAASDKCKPRTTKCIPIPGLGFRRGSYRCQCKDGYYFPDTYARVRYYNGTVVEEEYEKKLMGYSSLYDLPDTFECLPCPEGCDICEDDRPCIVSLNWVMRISILILEIIVICCLPAVALFTWKYGNVKVVRAASPALLRMIILGSFFIYCTTLVTYPRPNVVTCTLRIWLREIGFSFSYGALMLKTWRISVIFRVRSAKAVKITDWDLMKRLGIIVTIFTVLLGIRTLVSPPHVIVGKTADDLKAFLCQTDWWDHAFTAMEMVLLVWGIRLCIVVRKAPSEFNESRFISMAIYNEFLLSIFLNVSMLFLQSPANPDLMYIIMFSHTQLTTTLLLVLIFGSKAYLVLRGRGSKGEDSQHVTKPQAAKFLSKAKSNNSHLTPSALSSGGKIELTIPGLQHVTDPDIQAEFRRLYYELEQLKDKNLRLGNRHLAARISAMQDAARQEEMQGMANNAHGGQHKNSLTDKSAKNHPKTPQEEEDSESDSGGGGGGGGGGLGSLMFGSKGPKVNNVLACMTDKIVCATFSADPAAMMDDDEGINGYPDTQDDNRETGLMGTRKSKDLEADGERRNSLSASSGSTSSQAAPASRAPASALALAAAPLLSPNALSLTFSSGTRRPSRGYKSQVTSPCVDFLSEALLPRRFSVSAIRESTSAFLTMPYSADHHQTVLLLNRTGPKQSPSRHALLPVSNAHACEEAPSDVIKSSEPTSPAAECPCCSSSSDNLVPDPASSASSSSSCTTSLRSCNNMKLPLSASKLLQYPLSPDGCLNGPADCTASPDTVISHFLTEAVDASVTSAHEAIAVALPVLAQQPRLRYNSRGRPKTDDKERFTEEVTV